MASLHVPGMACKSLGRELARLCTGDFALDALWPTENRQLITPTGFRTSRGILEHPSGGFSRLLNLLGRFESSDTHTRGIECRLETLVDYNLPSAKTSQVI